MKKDIYKLSNILTYFRFNQFKRNDEQDIQLFNNSVFGFLSELDSKGFNLESLEYFEDWSGNKLCERLIDIEVFIQRNQNGSIKAIPKALKGAEKEIFKRSSEINALELFIENNQNKTFQYNDFKKLLQTKTPSSSRTPFKYFLRSEIENLKDEWDGLFYFSPIMEQWIKFLEYELKEYDEPKNNSIEIALSNSIDNLRNVYRRVNSFIFMLKVNDKTDFLKTCSEFRRDREFLDVCHRAKKEIETLYINKNEKIIETYKDKFVKLNEELMQLFDNYYNERSEKHNINSSLFHVREVFNVLNTYSSNKEVQSKNEIPLKTKPTKSELLKPKLLEYGFNELEKVTALTDEKMNDLIKKLAENELPYQIAMLDYLGFLKYLSNNYFNTNEKLFAELSKILNAQNRTIKGNIYVLNPISNEDKKRYTAHLHKQKVINDYEQLI